MWLGRLIELAPAVVLGSRPVYDAGQRLNQGFVWDQTAGYRAAHLKYYLPNEDRFWDGEVLGLTSSARPFVTMDIDRREAECAKSTYPRYVRE